MSNNVILKNYVEYTYPGSFVSKTSAKELHPGESPLPMPERAYAYQTFQKQTVIAPDGEILYGAQRNHSKKYVKGELWDMDAAKQRGTKILVDNMRSNNWTHVLKCAQGCIPFYHDKMVLLAP